MNKNEVVTLKDAQQYNREHWHEGCKCLACGQRVQLYNYKFFASSAFALIRLFNLTETNPDQEWFHVKDYAEAGKDRPRAHHFAELRFWELIEKCDVNDDPAKKSSGYWKITEKGKQFVNEEIKVQSRILIYNNIFVGFAENSSEITVREALGNKFDYEELMGFKKVLDN